MKQFSQWLTLACISAIAYGKKTFELNATVTPKRDSPNMVDPYLKQNFLSLRQNGVQEEDDVPGHILAEEAAIVAGGDEAKIVSTSDIDNYFNLQITTKLYFGSEQDPHDLILDTGSMVSLHHCKYYKDYLKRSNFDFCARILTHFNLLHQVFAQTC